MYQAYVLLAPMLASRFAVSVAERQQGYEDSAPLEMQLASLVQDAMAGSFSGDRP